MARVLSGVSRSTQGRQHGVRWGTVPMPDVVTGAQKLMRNVRYILLNATRAGLVEDPLAWPYSTHRDLVGAVADPWVDAETLAKQLRRSRRRALDALHRYVTADPSVHVEGSPLPAPYDARVTDPPGLTALATAAIAASRSNVAALARSSPTRRLLFGLIRRLHPALTAVAASTLGVHTTTVLRAPPPTSARWSAALLCLGDARLLRLSEPVCFGA